MGTVAFPKLKPLNEWNGDIKKPILIAGPCSAESPEQLLEVAESLMQTQRVAFMRAGVWKPRTSPGSFEGFGTEALRWLRDVKSETGMPFATEVGNGNHVYEALKYGADVLWIGARTVSNPFTIQEIASALQGVDIPILVKNPLSTDLSLWIGSIGRLYNAGIHRIGAVHRGFTWWKKSTFRNQPFWKIPLELKKQYPDLPVICDPSHISGDRKLVPLISRRAVDLGFDGLMVEVHPNPSCALSDAEQQLTPHEFELMLKWIDVSTGEDQPYPDEMLSELRSEIDDMDEMLLWALSNRMELSGKIASVKKQTDLEVVQPVRWNKVLEKVTAAGLQSGLREKFILRLFSLIHEESIDVQKEKIGDKE